MLCFDYAMLKSQNESINLLKVIWSKICKTPPPLKKPTPPLNGLIAPKNRANCNPPPNQWFSKISNPLSPRRGRKGGGGTLCKLSQSVSGCCNFVLGGFLKLKF